MSLSAFDRRRSKRFAELVDETSRRRRHRLRDEQDSEMMALVSVTRSLGRLPVAPDPDPEFRTGLRAMLIAKIERDGIGATVAEKAAQASARAALSGKTQVVRQVAEGHTTGRTRAAVLAGVTAGALALSGVSAASTDSLPGDPLYQVKRSSERAQLALAGSELSRGQLYLEFARKRLAEARRVEPDLLTRVLADMNADTVQGTKLLAIAAVQHNDAGALDAIVQFVAQQRETLADMRAASSAGVDALRESRDLLDEVVVRALALKAALAQGCSMADGDHLGPTPGTC